MISTDLSSVHHSIHGKDVWFIITSLVSYLLLDKEVTIVKCSSSLRNVNMWIKYDG